MSTECPGFNTAFTKSHGVFLLLLKWRNVGDNSKIALHVETRTQTKKM